MNSQQSEQVGKAGISNNELLIQQKYQQQENRPISPITLSRPQNMQPKSISTSLKNQTEPIVTSAEQPQQDQISSENNARVPMQFQILRKSRDESVEPKKANLAVFQNKYDMLDPLNKVLYGSGTYTESNRSGLPPGDINTASIDSGRNSLQEQSEKEKVSRLRMLQVKEGKVDAAVAQKVHQRIKDLSDVLDIKQAVSGKRRATKRYQSPQRQKRKAKMETESMFVGLKPIHYCNPQKLKPVAITADDKIQPGTNPNFRYRVDINKQAFAGDQSGSLKHNKQPSIDTIGMKEDDDESMCVQIQTKINGIQVGSRSKHSLHKRRGSQEVEAQENLTLLGINYTSMSSAINTRHSVSIRDHLSPDVRNSLDQEQKQKASLNSSPSERKSHVPVKVNTINITTNKAIKNRDIKSQSGTGQPKQHCFKRSNRKTQDFIVKRFQNSLESKVQRQARLKGNSSAVNPYYQSTSLRNSTMSTIEIDRSDILRDNQTSLMNNSDDSSIGDIKRGGKNILQNQAQKASSMYVSDKGQTTYFAEIPVTRIEDQFLDKSLHCSMDVAQAHGGEYLILDGIQSTAQKDDGIDLCLETVNMNSIEEDIMQQQASTFIKLDRIVCGGDPNLIQKRKMLQKRINQTKAFAQRADNMVPSQGDLGVCHLKLHPRDLKRTQTAKQAIVQHQSRLTRSIVSSIEGYSQSQNTNKAQLNQKSVLTRNSSNIKNAKRKVLRKRLEASIKFNKDFNEPISIRRPQPVQHIPVVQESLTISQSFHDVASMTADADRPANGGIKAFIKRSNKMHSLVVSAKSSNQLKREDSEDGANQSMLRVSQTSNQMGSSEEIQTKCFKIRRSNQHQHKSLAQMRTASSRLKVKSALMRRSYNVSTNLAVNSQDATILVSREGDTNLEQDGPPDTGIYANESYQLVMQRPQTQQNPYNLTLAERESIKEKNRSLISQFQKSELKKQLFEDPRTGCYSHEQETTLRGDTQHSGLLFEIAKKVPTADIGVGPSISFGAGRDLQDVYSIHGQVPGTPTNEGESNSPITRPAHQNDLQLKGSLPRYNDFETAQLTDTSRTNKDATEPISHIPFKERPASSKDGTGKMKTVLRNAQNAEIKGHIASKTRIISKGVTTRLSYQRQGQNVNQHDALDRDSNEIAKFYSNVSRLDGSSRQGNYVQQTKSSVNTVEISHMNIRERNQTSLSKIFDEKETEKLQLEQSNDEMSKKSELPQPLLIPESKQLMPQGQTNHSGELEITSQENEELFQNGGGTIEEHQNVSQLDAEYILNLTQHQIENLKFQDVCSAQQVLYKTLTTLQEQLNEATAQRKVEQNRQFAEQTILEDQNLYNTMIVERTNSHQIKHKRFTTNYINDWKNKTKSMVMSANQTPFNKEQRELRRRISYENRFLYGGNAPPNQSTVQHETVNNQLYKVRLVGDTDEYERRSDEVNNYFRFKRKQEKAQRRRQIFEQQRDILGQCSPEEVLILGKIKILLDTKNMLVEKAKLCTMQELISPELEKQPSATFQRRSLSKASGQKSSIDLSSAVDQVGSPTLKVMNRKHLPSAKRVVSRQSLHKLNKSGENSKAQTLIRAATDKLNSMNRLRSNSNQRSSVDYCGKSENNKRYSISSGSQTKAKIKVQPHLENYSSRDEKNTEEGPHLNNDSVAEAPLKQQSASSTINLYLKKVVTDNSVVASSEAKYNQSPHTKVQIHEKVIYAKEESIRKEDVQQEADITLNHVEPVGDQMPLLNSSQPAKTQQNNDNESQKRASSTSFSNQDAQLKVANY